MSSVTAKESGSPANNQVKKICRHFARGACEQGEKCKFLHEVQESKGSGKSHKTASNKVVKAPKETNPELIALMEKVNIAEENVRVAKVMSELNARLIAASSYEQQPQVAVVARKEKEKEKPAFLNVFDDELNYAEYFAREVGKLKHIIMLSESSITKEALCEFHTECSKYGYNAMVKGSLKVLGVTQGIQSAVFKSNPSEFRNHYKSVDPNTHKLYIPREAAAFYSG